MTTNSTDAIIAVFETQPYWGPELQRQFARTSIRVRECRAIHDLLPSVVDCDSALIVIDFDADIEGCLSWLGLEIKNSRRRWPIIACGSETTADFEWSLREAGVTEFLPEVIPGDAFARLCRRQLGLHLKVNKLG